MNQSRLYFTGSTIDASRAYRALEAAFEEDGWPLALVEIDEAADLHEVSLYAEGNVAEIEDRIRAALPDMRLEIAVEALEDIDWVSRSLDGLRPVRAGRFLVHGGHNRGRRRPGDLAIEIEAGLAFGTGHHGTTAGCLDMIQAVVTRERPRNALDLGTGSAVLAIAMARLARIPVLATDIDPVAVRVAAQNVRLNQAAGYVRTAAAPGFHHPLVRHRAPFDLIVANILARPLMKLAPEMAQHLRPGGSIILSGILERQRQAVISAYAGQRFRHLATLHREGWVTLHLKR